MSDTGGSVTVTVVNVIPGPLFGILRSVSEILGPLFGILRLVSGDPKPLSEDLEAQSLPHGIWESLGRAGGSNGRPADWAPVMEP